MRVLASILHRVHRLRRVELAAVAVATAGAGGAVGHVELHWLDAVGPWADLLAGAFAAVGLVAPFVERRAHRGEKGDNE